MSEPPPQIDILHHHAHLIALNKPAGVPTAGDQLDQPGSLQYMLTRALRRTVWAVHQLDRDTSGVNLFTTQKSQVALLTQRLKLGSKYYLGICRGAPPQPTLQIDAPLGFLTDLKRHGVTPDGKPALTSLTTLASHPLASLLLLRLHTGRTHQIRAHLAHLHIPLLGDPRYDDCFAQLPPELRAPRQALHAWHVTLEGGLTLTAPPPTDLIALAHRFGWNLATLTPSP